MILPDNKHTYNKNTDNKYKKNLGIIGESVAANYLRSQHYKILDKNFRFKKYGEIDIIAQDNEYTCFIEVKTRTNNKFGTPSESVTKTKQQKIKLLAKIYLSNNNLFNTNIRFDIVEVVLEKSNIYTINLIRNAFY